MFNSGHKAAGEKKGFTALAKEISTMSLLQEWQNTLRSSGKRFSTCDLCSQALKFNIMILFFQDKDFSHENLCTHWAESHEGRPCHGTRKVKEIVLLHVNKGQQLQFPSNAAVCIRPCIKDNLYTCLTSRIIILLKIYALRLCLLYHASELPPPFTV